MFIALNPQRLFRWLLVCIGALVSLHILALWLVAAVPGNHSEIVREMLDLNEERNLPALFSTMQLAMAAVMLFLLFHLSRRKALRDGATWLALAGVFAFLATDEYFMIHERLSRPVTRLLGMESVATVAWVVPYAVLAATVAALFFRFWWRQPRDIRWQMVVAATVYVGGALGLELLGSSIVAKTGEGSAPYVVEQIVEESMEMIGIALFIRTLAQLIQSRVGSLTLQFDTRTMDSHEQLMKDLDTADRRKGERRAG
jgi:hypothetical protein